MRSHYQITYLDTDHTSMLTEHIVIGKLSDLSDHIQNIREIMLKMSP